MRGFLAASVLGVARYGSSRVAAQTTRASRRVRKAILVNVPRFTLHSVTPNTSEKSRFNTFSEVSLSEPSSFDSPVLFISLVC